jgi:hypothetical protein
MDLLVEVRQVVFLGPRLNLLRLTIRPAIRVVPVRIALMEPPLILALEFVIENDALDVGFAFGELLRLAQVRLVDLHVVFDLARLHEAGIEHLMVLLLTVHSMGIQQLLAAVGEDHDRVSLTTQTLGPDEPLFAQVA